MIPACYTGFEKEHWAESKHPDVALIVVAAYAGFSRMLWFPKKYDVIKTETKMVNCPIHTETDGLF